MRLLRQFTATTVLAVLLLFSFTQPALAQQGPRTAQITASYTDKVQYDVYEADATAGAITLTLFAPSKRRVVTVIKTDSSANAVTVATAGTGATINGASTYVISNQHEAAILTANGKSGSSGFWRVAAKRGSTGSDILIASQARGDIIRRGASAWERLAAKTSGQILVGDGTDVVSVAVSGDATLSSAGAVAVTDLSLASEARGDLARRGAATWARLPAATAGQVILGDGTDVISAALSGDVASVSSAGSVQLNEKLIRYAEATISSANITGTGAGQLGEAAGVEVVAAPGAGKAIEIISATVIYDFDTAAYTDGGNVGVKYTGSDLVTGVVSNANSLAAAGDKIALLLPAVPTNNQMLTNTGLSLTAAVAFTQPGTAAGVVRVKIAYRVHTTGL